MPGEQLFSPDHTTKSAYTLSSVIFKLLLGSATITVATVCYFLTESIIFSALTLGSVMAALLLALGWPSSRGPHKDKQQDNNVALKPATAAPPPSLPLSSTQVVPPATAVVPLMDWHYSSSASDLPVSQAIDFNLRTTVEETVLRFSAVAQEKGIELSCLFSSDSPTPFRGDPGDLRLTLMNLIDYVFASLTGGEVVIRALLQQQTATHATFRFSVSGLSHASLGVATSPVSHNGGASLPPFQEEAAIAISKQLVKSWGGQLEIESNPDRNITIWFTVTLEKQPPKVLSDLPPRSSLAGIRMLLVGSDFSLSDEETLAWGLTNHHVPRSTPILSILTAAGQEGRSYDVVMFACQELDGEVLDLASHIRATDALATSRLVFLAASGKKGDAQHVRQTGFDAYLTQPVSSDLMFECLATILSQAPQTSPPHLPLVTRYTLAEARTRGRARILVVDSSLSDQKHAVRILEELGYRADIATTAREALEAQARLPYVAVLLPCQMPGIDGIAAAIHIRQQEGQEGAHTPLIGILQFENNVEATQCRTAGMDAVLVKPLRAASLKTTLDRYSQLLAEQNTAHRGSLEQASDSIEIDFHAALARVDGDKELFDEMTALFIEEYPKALSKISEAITRQDPQALAYSANALKGALGNFAAMKAIDTTARLELMGRRGDLAQAQPVLNDLDKHLARLHALLTDFRVQAAA